LIIREFYPKLTLITSFSFAQIDSSLYDRIFEASEGLIRVKKGKAFGFIDATGQIVIPIQYKAARNFSSWRAAVKIDSLWGFVNPQGEEVVAPLYDRVWAYSEGLALVRRKGRYGYINLNGIPVVLLQYDHMPSR
jgi:hypothetical protein